MKFEVRSYDVWGNKKDGYEINNVFASDIIIVVPDDWSKSDIIKQLKEEWGMKKGYQARHFQFEGDDEYSLYLYRLSDYLPVCELRRVH